MSEFGLGVTASTAQNDAADVTNVLNNFLKAILTTLNAAEPATSPTPTATATARLGAVVKQASITFTLTKK